MSRELKYKEWLLNAPKIHYSRLQQFVPLEYLGEAQAAAPAGVQYTHYGNATEQVYAKFGMPFPLYDYQKAWVDAFADKPAAGMYLEVGAGKTGAATVAALYHRLKHGGHTIVLMPPVLIRQWYEWLHTVEGAGSVLMYKGTPPVRSKLDLDHDFVLMSLDIFKRDFRRIYDFFYDRNVTLIVDEAVSVKNPATQNHKCVWAFQNLDTRALDMPQRKKSAAMPKPAKPQEDGNAVSRLKALLKEKFS
ncbi:hypothetical protein V9W64_10590 [Neisseria leonii]|uniref:Helicase ATP-binding domain-containing protein n=1 Tax=Neisseria leonii TaxID=2995413 RepID=A0A9X4E2X0_9NEIS|nr:hypothetical protein [Neisseria sp. 51.81]MDD9328229.1 hypothetical protein [Neisseria sp. 51.81]